MNADTGFSKGTAFVQFDTKEMAEKCVSTIQDDKTVIFLNFKFLKQHQNCILVLTSNTNPAASKRRALKGFCSV